MKRPVRPCTVCTHPGRVEIDKMLLDNVSAKRVAERTAAMFPGAPAPSEAALYRHKANHNLLPGEEKAVVPLSPAELDLSLGVPEKVSPAMLFEEVMRAAFRNIRRNPETVTLTQAVAFIEAMRKAGAGGNDLSDFLKEWDAVELKKDELRTKAKGKTATTVDADDWEVTDEQSAG